MFVFINFNLNVYMGCSESETSYPYTHKKANNNHISPYPILSLEQHDETEVKRSMHIKSVS